ncbi:hypothetical protein A2118_03730 [Candidatus Kaiserbacteria bacterium GWA2_50_9]|uniref:Uncharacterized protein n=1 Tax=Candidatus Kaiserbacteria bacterium GWA2_50_9 TaxID=1798474 RepID=A0A1F6BW33_9BACT|nr:MAG: hypothetical protein A2118_03730 [Candidatus Kaiserbacteria bacterium GWA2_50_9]
MKGASHQRENGGYIIGRQAFAKISAVEGIHLTQELSKDFQSFEQHRLSPEDRRQAIVNKYVR